jgi:hypothetical protein
VKLKWSFWIQSTGTNILPTCFWDVHCDAFTKAEFFQLFWTNSSNETCEPPNMSKELGRHVLAKDRKEALKAHLPYVRSTRPSERRSTRSKSERS